MRKGNYPIVEIPTIQTLKSEAQMNTNQRS